jgi:hypothetical protein
MRASSTARSGSEPYPFQELARSSGQHRVYHGSQKTAERQRYFTFALYYRELESKRESEANVGKVKDYLGDEADRRRAARHPAAAR